MEKKTLALCFFVLFLFAAGEMVLRTEGKTCEALSGSFSGPCGYDSTCNYHCRKKEHLLSGRCKDSTGIFKACFCTRNC